MIPLAVEVLDVRAQRGPQCRFAEEDQLREALVFHRPHPALRVRIQVRAARRKVAPDTVAYADGERHQLIVEFAIPGAPTETIDVKILEDSVYLLAPA